MLPMWLRVLVHVPSASRREERRLADRIQIFLDASLSLHVTAPKALSASKREVGLYLSQNTQFTEKEEKCSMKDSRNGKEKVQLFKN